MVKIHSKEKRKWKIGTHLGGHRFFHANINKVNRYKTFKTEEKAIAWAKTNNLENYEVLPAKRNKKFKVKPF